MWNGRNISLGNISLFKSSPTGSSGYPGFGSIPQNLGFDSPVPWSKCGRAGSHRDLGCAVGWPEDCSSVIKKEKKKLS